MDTNTVMTIDVSTIPPQQRHPLIFGNFENLAVDDSIELYIDHAPGPLLSHFKQEYPGEFEWTWLEEGPSQWHILITRTGAGN